MDRSRITSIVVEEGVTSIGSYAFSYCSNVTSVSIPSTVTSIGDTAMAGLGALTELTLPEGIARLGTQAFAGCGLTRIHIPASVTEMDGSQFQLCSKLTELTVAEESETFCAVDHVLYSGDMKNLLFVAAGKTGILEIPAGVETALTSAFGLCDRISEIHIPASLSSLGIGTGSFIDCDALEAIVVDENNETFKSVDGVLFTVEGEILIACPVRKGGDFTVPAGTQVIGDWAFYNSALTGIMLPEGLTSIGSRAFMGCAGLKEVYIPGTVTDWGEFAFTGAGLQQLEIGYGVEELGEQAFSNNTGLTDAILPNSLTGFGYQGDAFTACDSMVIHAHTDSAAYEYSQTYGFGFEELDHAYENGVCKYCAEMDPDSGSCGDDLTWRFDAETGTLTINGTGEMYDYASAAPMAMDPVTSVPRWSDNTLNILHVVIEEGVTSIGSSAFWNCYYLQDVVIPSTVTSIGDSAFTDCEALTAVTLPEGLTYLGTEAFRRTGLKKITIPAHVSFGEGVFSNCYDLSEITLSEGLTDTGAYTFQDCDSITTLEFPSTLLTIGEGAFWACDGLEEVTLSENLQTIGDVAFSNCIALKQIRIPASVTTIGKEAFGWCSALTAIEVDEGSTTYCSDASGVLYDAAKTRLIQAPAGLSGAYEIPASVTAISDNAFCGCSGLTAVTFMGKAPTFEGSYVFSGVAATAYYPEADSSWTSGVMASYGGSITWESYEVIVASGDCGENAAWALTSRGVLRISGTGAMGEFGRNNMPWQAYKSDVVSLVIEEGITTVCDYAFYQYQNLRSISLPTTLTGIGSYAFNGVTNVNVDLVLPEGLTTIGDYAFASNSFTSVTMPGTLKRIGEYAFAYGDDIRYVRLNEGLESIGTYAFYECQKLAGTLTIPEGITTIEPYTFYNTAITGLNLPSTLERIQGSAFYSCGELQQLTLPEGLKSIGTDAFRWCSGITGTLVIPDSVTYLDGFYNCEGITGLKLGSGVKNIAGWAFKNCTGLTGELVLPDGLTIIGDQAFNMCSGLTGMLTIPDSVTTLGYLTFGNCSGLTGLKLSEALTEIPNSAFANCSGITGELVIPDSVQTVHRGAFEGLSGLTKITLGTGLTTIGTDTTHSADEYSPFYGCSGVTEVRFHAVNAPKLYNNPFAGMSILETVYMPAENFESYAPVRAYLSDEVTIETDWEQIPVTGLTVDRAYSKSVVLRWDDHIGHGLTGYTILRDGEVVGTAGDTTFTDSGLTAETTYSYAVCPNFDDVVGVACEAVTATTILPLISKIAVKSGTDKIGNVAGYNEILVYVPDLGNLEALGEKQTSVAVYYSTGGERTLIGNATRNADLSSDKVAVYSTVWDLTQISGGSYTYQVQAVDNVHNVFTMESQTVTVPAGTTPPEAAISCETTQVVGAEYVIDASASTDDSAIVSYLFDFGDGTTSTEVAPLHVYAETGTYSITLTVTDDDGNTDTAVQTVVVESDELLGFAKIFIVDEHGAPVPEAPVYFDLGEEYQVIKLTDGNGMVTFPATVGKHTVGCVIPNNEWLPVKHDMIVTAGGTSVTTMTLVNKPLVEGSFEVERMTLEEIIAAGIDIDAAENQNYVEVHINLEYENMSISTSVPAGPGFTPLPNPIPVPKPSPDPDPDPDPNPNTGPGPDPGPDRIVVGGVLRPYKFSEEVTVILLDIPVGVSSLKEFFDVRLHIINNAGSEFYLVDNVVTLNVPDGLTLMETEGTDPQTVNISQLRGQTTETLEWILRGDAVGEYYLDADFSGILAEFNELIKANFRAEEPIEVLGMSDLRLIVDVAKELDKGTLYYNVSLVNEGDLDVYRPAVGTSDVLIEMEMFNATGANEAEKYDFDAEIISKKNLSASLSELPDVLSPGERLTLHYMNVADTTYTECIMALKNAFLEYENQLGLKAELVERELSFFTANLSTNINTIEKAQNTLSKGEAKSAYEYVINNEYYVYWAMANNVAGLEIKSDSEETLFETMSLNFSDALGKDDQEQARAMVLASVDIAAEENTFAKYDNMLNWLALMREIVKGNLTGLEVTPEQAEAFGFALDEIESNRKWELYKAIHGTTYQDLDKLFVDTVCVGLGIEPSEEVKEWIHKIYASKPMGKLWKKIGVKNDFLSTFVDILNDVNSDISIYVAAHSDLETYNLYLNSLIQNMGFSKDAIFVGKAALDVKNAMNSESIMETIIVNTMQEGFWLMLEAGTDKVMKAAKKVPIVNIVVTALEIGTEAMDKLFNMNEQYDVANNIRFLNVMSNSIVKAVKAARTTFKENGDQESASNYMKLLSYLLDLRALGESQAAQYGVSFEKGILPIGSWVLFDAACDYTNAPGHVESWYEWRDFVEDKLSMYRVTLLKNPLSSAVSGNTAPTVTFNYLTGQTVEAFTSDYEYSLDGGATWTTCDGSPIGVQMEKYSIQLLVRRVNTADSQEKMTASVMINGITSLESSGIEAVITENGYRIDGLDEERKYEVTFSETPVTYEYGDALEREIMPGESSYEYDTDQEYAHIYIRAVADADHYATHAYEVQIVTQSAPTVDIDRDEAAVNDAYVKEAIDASGGNGAVVLTVSDRTGESGEPITALTMTGGALARVYTSADEPTLTLELGSADVKLDTGALGEVLNHVNSLDEEITVTVEPIDENQLSMEQQIALNQEKVSMVISATMTCGNTTISDFGRGTVTVSIPFTVKAPATIEEHSLWYIADNGTMEELSYEYVDGRMVTVMEHFSEYVILHNCEHEWKDATCTDPKTCGKCGETEGEPLGHKWNDATCTEPKTCSVCGETEGEALGHKWNDATCTEPKTCSVCGETEGEPLGHDFVDGKCSRCEEKDPDYKEPEVTGVTRIFGATRYDTAFKAADQLKENLGIEKFENIVVAYGEDFADALSGSYLANQKNAPILLVKNRNKEINLVKDYIKANLTSGGTVYLLGGVNAVPKAMESGLEGFNVKRLAGATRYETNLEILKEAGISGNDILVCTGLDFADGLSASAVNKPILLVKDSLRATQVNYLKALGTKNFYLIGGTNAVNKRIESALGTYGTTQRIEGATRYYTSVNIAKTFFPNAKTAVLAYAQNFPDGLSGGCLACSMDAPLILTANGKQAPAVAYAKEAGIAGGAVLGGTGLIPDRVANAIFRIP